VIPVSAFIVCYSFAPVKSLTACTLKRLDPRQCEFAKIPDSVVVASSRIRFPWQGCAGPSAGPRV